MNPAWLVLAYLAAVIVPPLFIAWRWRTYPTGRMIQLLVIPALATAALVWWPGSWPVLLVTDVLLVLVALVDLPTCPRRGAFSADRKMGRTSSLRRRHAVEVTVENHSGRPARVDVRDDVDPILGPDRETFELTIPARSRAAVEYELRTKRRGAFAFERVYFRTFSALGLWQHYFDTPVESTLHVYPDMKQLAQYAVLARTDRLNLLGMRRVRRIGMEHDFERLRDYTVDDNYKFIDWRSTARRRKLTVKDFQASQSQRLIFLVDCGRMMTNEAAGLSLLDHGFNALLMLAHVALSRGDSVGMITFSDRIHGFVPPRSGMSQMNRLLHAAFDRFPTLVESRYDEAFRYLNARCRRRSLVVLLTNVIDEVNTARVEAYLSNLTGRHLPMGILLRDHRLFDAVEAEEGEGSDVFEAAAAAGILSWRRQVLRDLESKGVLSLDVFPERMTAPLVNRYLEIKARNLL